MKKIKLLWLTCLTVFLLGLTPGGAVWADDGGGDGGGDGGDDGGEGHDDGEHDGDWHHDGHQGHHWVDHHHWYGGWGPWGYGPGFGFGGFGFMPPFYPSPYYAYPRVVVQPPPPVYIQQPNVGQPASQPQNNYWHYCQASEGYYPQVQECPDGWVQVPPQAQLHNQENPM